MRIQYVRMPVIFEHPARLTHCRLCRPAFIDDPGLEITRQALVSTALARGIRHYMSGPIARLRRATPALTWLGTGAGPKSGSIRR